MLFGTIVRSLVDKQWVCPFWWIQLISLCFGGYGDEDDGFWVVRGRMRACVPYCISYILSCITKHSPRPQYKILMIGRVLGGTATSLLFSAFESCLVAEHNKVPVHIPLSTEMLIPRRLPSLILIVISSSFSPWKQPLLFTFCFWFWFCVHLLPVLGI
jgi:hypothetical protein